jgi:glutamate synthase domain-containing protein 2
MVIYEPLKCTNCLACLEVCPSGALSEGEAVTEEVGGPTDVQEGLWKPHIIKEIHEKSITGKHRIRGCGTTKRIPSFDDLIILPAQLSRLSIDTYREPCNTRTVLGGRYAKNPLVVETPILIGGMSFGAISKEAKIALAKGSAMVGTATNNGEGGLLPEEREHAYKLIVQVLPSRFGFTLHNIEVADALEIVVGMGAKPGLAGHLMASKITEEIAKMRQIPPGIDLHSHGRHSDIFGADDLQLKIEELRELTDWEKPIFLKIGAGRVIEDVKIAAKVGVDGITVDGMQGGTGAGPKIAIDNLGIPSMPAVVQAVRALEEMGVKDEMSLIVSGGIKDGGDVAKALAMGADAVAIGTGALVAMGCTVCLKCHEGNCHAGIGTQKEELRKRLNVDEAAKKVANYLTAMTNELVILAKAAGKTDVHNLEREDLRALTVEASAITGIPLVGTNYTFTEKFGYF